MKLYENEQLRKELAKKNIMAIHHLNEDNLTPEQEKMVNDEVNAVMADKHLLELHKKANALMDRNNEQKKVQEKLINRYKQLTGRSMNMHGLDRMSYLNMDISGTPEAEKKNMEYLISLCDRDYAKKEYGKILNTIRNIDMSKTVFNTADEAIDNFEKNFQTFKYMFVYEDGINNGKLQFSEETMNFINEIKPLIQQGGFANSFANYYGSNVAITVPDKDKELLVGASRKVSKNIAAHKDDIDGIDVKGNGVDHNTDEAINTGFTLSVMKKNLIGDLPDKFADGTIPKNLFNYNAKQNDKPIPLKKAIDAMISGAKDITFEKKPEEELKKYEDDFANSTEPVDAKSSKDFLLKEYYEAPKILTLMENTFNDLKKFQTTLKKANHFYSHNHAEYTNLMNKLNQFLVGEASSYSFTDFKDNVNEIKELASDYVASKVDQKKNSTRQKRYDTCKELYKVTNDYEKSMNSLMALPVKDPDIIKLDCDKAEELDMAFDTNVKTLAPENTISQ